jgi:hypothetical protein
MYTDAARDVRFTSIRYIESVATTLRSGSKGGVHVDRLYFRPAARNAWNAVWASWDLSAALKACISAAI